MSDDSVSMTLYDLVSYTSRILSFGVQKMRTICWIFFHEDAILRIGDSIIEKKRRYAGLQDVE